MNILFIGPQGSGKGTHSSFVSKKMGIPTISMGDLLRAYIQQDNDKARKIKEIMNNGTLVPDELTLEILKERIKKSDCKKGFILDGFPRNMNQLQLLEKITKVDKVILLEIPDEVGVRRLSSRWQCRKCGDIYNTISKPPKKAGVCDVDGGVLYQRDDDKPAAIRERLKTYHEQTAPLIKYYETKNVLKRVDANGPVDVIDARVMKALEK